jgi:hypothetical protein
VLELSEKEESDGPRAMWLVQSGNETGGTRNGQRMTNLTRRDILGRGVVGEEQVERWGGWIKSGMEMDDAMASWQPEER